MAARLFESALIPDQHGGCVEQTTKHGDARIGLVVGPQAKRVVNCNGLTELGDIHERHRFYSFNAGVFCYRSRLRTILRSDSLRSNVMTLESILMLAVSVLLMVYLLYALLMPEKF